MTKANVGFRAEGGGSVWHITEPPPLLLNIFDLGWGEKEIYAYMSLHRTRANKVLVSYFQFTKGFDKIETVDGPYIQGKLDL